MDWWTEYTSRNSSICGQNFLLEIGVFRDGGSSTRKAISAHLACQRKSSEQLAYSWSNGNVSLRGYCFKLTPIILQIGKQLVMGFSIFAVVYNSALQCWTSPVTSTAPTLFF